LRWRPESWRISSKTWRAMAWEGSGEAIVRAVECVIMGNYGK
jgi:hypothetical protein